MGTTDYCSYELAKKLKEAGFDEPCREFYNSERVIESALEAYNFNHLGMTYQGEWFTDAISGPTLWQVQKWLREKHHVSVRVNYILDTRQWFADWLNLDSGEYDDCCGDYFSYEAALSAGIEAALELIKDKQI